MSKHPVRTVTTTGQGTARVVPDAAVLRLAVAHRAEGVAEAFAGVDAAARTVAKVAKDYTEHTKISSANLNVYPAHDNQGNQVGFEARHTLAIVCADLTAAGALLTQLVRHVGNSLSVEGVSLEVTDPKEAVVAAREAAFADARTRAEHLAELGGEILGSVLAITEAGGGGGHHERFTEAAKMADMAIEPGESTIGASVTVTWALAD